jgi:hypothetical protein
MPAGMGERRVAESTMRRKSGMAKAARAKTAAMKAMEAAAKSSTVKPAEATAAKSAARSCQRHAR